MPGSPLAPMTLRDVVVWGAALLGGVALFLVLLRGLQAWVKRTQADDPQSGRGDWEKALADYKNLRDQGVLSEEEYRKIRTLVEPHVQRPEGGGVMPRASRLRAGETTDGAGGDRPGGAGG